MRASAKAPSAEPSTRGNGNTFSFGVLVAILVCAAAFLGFGAPMASAAPEATPAWTYKLTFGSEGNVEGDLFRNELALDSNGNIFASEPNAGGVMVFKPSATEGGEFLTMVASGPVLSNIAIDQSNDALYTYESAAFNSPGAELRMRRWTSDGLSPPTYTLDPSFEVEQGDGFGVDPSTGDILVTDPGAKAVRRYDTGTLVATIATPSIASSWILPMADGSFYVASASGPDLTHFSGSGTLLSTSVGVGTLSGLTYDPVRELLVASVGNQLKNYSLAGVLMSSSPSEGGGAGTVVDASGFLYEENPSGTVNVYTQALQPGVEAPVVSAIDGHSAHVEAEVEPGEEGAPGEAPLGSKAHLEYSSDGGQNWQKLPDQEFSESGVATVKADLTDLLANSEYLTRVVAENSLRLKAASTATSFHTAIIAPDAETAPASGLGETVATLNGTINPNGLQTTYHFEYGTTMSYGSRIPVTIDAVAGDQRASRSFSSSVAGLAPETVYHYRIVAQSSAGESAGVDRTFTTAGAGEAAPPRAYELVTPVDKRGAQVANDLHFQAATGGSAVAVNVSSGPDGGESALIRQSYVLWRGADGWSDWVNSDAPLSAERGILEASTMAISEDFTKALVVSNRALASGGIAGGGNLYVKDLRTGSYTFVGGAPGQGAYQQLAGVGPAAPCVFAAAAPDFSWILFWSDSGLVSGAEDRQLYRWTVDEGLTLESRLPDGSIPALPLAVTPANLVTLELPAASADGSFVAFDLDKYLEGGVYIRENEQSTPISVSRRMGDDSSEVRPGILNAVTPSGEYVFFHSKSQLTEDTPPPSGPEFLYRYDTETEELTYISTQLADAGTVGVYGVGDDGRTVYLDDGAKTVAWHDGEVDTVSPDRVASSTSGNYVTDNGRYFAWIGEDREAHLYDVEKGESVCVSCPASGSSAKGAHFVPKQRGMANRSPRGVLEDGTMFFDTPNALLPSDHNSAQDVYSYKNGYLTLISPGNANVGATFVDASDDGVDLYFQTEQGILPQDVDGSFDVYDARIGGGFSQGSTKVACSGEGCRGAATVVPRGAAIGSSDSDQGGAPAINRLKPLSSSDRTKLAMGKKAHLKLQVSGPGRVKVLGTASGIQVIKASKQAKQAGALSVPIKLSKKGLKALRRQGSLAIRLTASLGDEGKKETSFTLKSAGPKKGGSS